MLLDLSVSLSVSVCLSLCFFLCLSLCLSLSLSLFKTGPSKGAWPLPHSNDDLLQAGHGPLPDLDDWGG